jgi:hypothetical protein
MAEFMKKDLSRRIDALIAHCAIGKGCDEAELMRLARQYGTVSDSYTFSKTMIAFDFEYEKQIALHLQKEVNDNIRSFRIEVCSPTRQLYSELGPHGNILKKRPPKPPKTRCNILGGKRRTRINSKRRH